MNAMGIIFANIYDSSLGELTNKRTMASLPFGGRYRQIDFILSNMANSGIRRVGIISRYKYNSLMNHIGSGEEWDLELQQGGLEFLSPYFTGNAPSSYQGKLDALHSVADYLEEGSKDDYVVLADPSVLYNIDLNKVLEAHVSSGKDITVVTKAGVANGKKRLDLAIKLDEQGQIADLTVDLAAPEGYLASMGLFVISKELLLHHVREAVARNRYRFERDFLALQFHQNNLTVGVYQHEGVVLFNESTQEYFESNLAILKGDVYQDLFFGNHPIYTKVRDRVPTYYGENSQISNCCVADGCVLDGSVTDSILFRQVQIAPGAQVENCVIMNDAVVGEGCVLKNVILDKDVVVRPGATLIGSPATPVIIKRGEVV